MSRSPEATVSQTQSWHGTPCAWLARLRGVVVVVVFTVLGGILAQFIPPDDLQDRPLKLNDPHSGATIAMILRRSRREDRRCIARAVVSFQQQAEVDFAASLITFGVGPSRSIPASDHVLVVDENGRLRETGVRLSSNLCQELVRVLLNRDPRLDFESLARQLSPPNGNLKQLLDR